MSFPTQGSGEIREVGKVGWPGDRIRELEAELATLREEKDEYEAALDRVEELCDRAAGVVHVQDIRNALKETT